MSIHRLNAQIRAAQAKARTAQNRHLAELRRIERQLRAALKRRC